VAALKDEGKGNLLGVGVDVVDYEAAVDRVVEAARAHRPYGVTALAVHGVMTGVLDRHHRHRLNALDLVTPDGQPVRWALNLLAGAGLRDRVYGPELMSRLCATAANEGLGIFLYGGREDTVHRLADALVTRFPGLVVTGVAPSRFRQLTLDEREAMIRMIRASGASLCFVGLGCPRQEIFAFECSGDLGMPVIAVGAAFDYHAGTVREPPAWIQRRGLQWLYRFGQDPRRLWRRYLLLNPLYCLLVALQWARLWRPVRGADSAPVEMVRHG
jgi:exopolysaccharide biosynthesis WecB/TagA/CpsF family protein